MAIVGEVISMAVITVVLLCALAGAIAALFNEEKGLGKEFVEGLRAIGYIFIPVAGIMAAVPYLSQLLEAVVGPAFSQIGADPAMAATTVIAVDMGGYQLADQLANNRESWIMAMLAGYMAGATIVFSIPVGLSLLDKRDHKYMALGALSGILSIPIGMLIACAVLMLLSPAIRPAPSIDAAASETLRFNWGAILLNLAPLAAIAVVLALGLHFAPRAMIRGFIVFGRVMDGAIKLVLVCAIVEYFTAIFFTRFLDGKGLFSYILRDYWRFDPIVGRERALEVAGYIGMMLAGAFPMVYLIKKFLARPMDLLGRRIGLEAAGAAGLLAAVANILAMFRLIKEMRAQDKVLCIAFSVCAAFLLGDHLAFTANFQPTLIPVVMAGKLGGGIVGFLLARWISVPRAMQMEREEFENEVKRWAAHAPELKDQPIAVAPLEGGLTNRNFRLDAGGRSYVLRIAGAESELLGIDREREIECLHAAAGAGVGPEIVVHLREEKALIRRYVPGKPLTAAEARQSDMLRRIAEALRRFHDYPAPADLGYFSPFEAARSYHALARARSIPLPEDVARAIDLAPRLERELLQSVDQPLCLCHNDLLAANLIDDGQTLWIIDWEYAGLGDRCFDLGNFAANCELTGEQEERLVECYFGEPSAERLRRVRLMRLASDLREAMWGYLQAGISQLHKPQHYESYARKHLDRFLVFERASKESFDAQ
jgi:ethanolamine transporter